MAQKGRKRDGGGGGEVAFRGFAYSTTRENVMAAGGEGEGGLFRNLPRKC